MAAPSSAVSRFDLSISFGEFNLLSNQKKFIGLKVLPPLAVEQEAASFAKVLIASYLTKIEETERAPRGTYSRDDYEWTTDSYKVQENGVEEISDDATIEMYGDILRVEQIAIIRAINRILSRMEYDAAAAVFNTATWTGAALTTTVAVPWTTQATADPLANIDAAHDKVNAGCGEDANTLICTKKGFRAIIRSARVEGVLKYNAAEVLIGLNEGLDTDTWAKASGLCQLLGVDQILIGRGFKNTADRGQTASLSRMWDDTMAMLCVVHDDGLNGDLENPMPQIGRTIFSVKNNEPMPGSDDAGLGSLIFDEYREEQRRGSVFRPRNKRQIKILQASAGHLLQGVTA